MTTNIQSYILDLESWICLILETYNNVCNCWEASPAAEE